jgi:predicted metallo-beta-lactamase superfamily hydrolase
MKITPLAADSFGVRSMATLVKTPDVATLIDPGVRLGPYRYDLPPHELEEDRRRDLWRTVRDAAKQADILTVSHYHFDHHEPDAPSIYKGKRAFLKDGKFHINRSQRERASAFVRALKKYPEEIQVADGNALDIGGTEIAFSPAVPHGYSDELGYVVMVRVSEGGETFVHTSDVQGPPLKEQLAFLLDSDPTVLYVDGPMTHMPEHYPEEMTKRSIANLTRIIRSTGIRTLILDHHALRDREWRVRMKQVLEAGEAHDVRVVTAAEFLGKTVDQLEANRDKLYGLGGTKDRDETARVKSPFP